MKIIEGLKRLRVIEKRMAKNCENITQYASMLSNERPAFGTEVEQRKEVAARIQANQDLFTEYLKLKRVIEHTNLNTTVQFNGVPYTLSDLLVIKRSMALRMVETYSALNDNAARARVPKLIQQASDVRAVLIERLYDEKVKNAGLDKWQDLHSNIDARLEVINATTDLIGM